MSNLWGQPRSDGPSAQATEPEPEPALDPAIAADNEAEHEGDTDGEVEHEVDADGEVDRGAEPVIDLVVEPVATRDDLPAMAELDALSSELDEIDAALAAMDADPSLPGRAAPSNT